GGTPPEPWGRAEVTPPGPGKAARGRTGFHRADSRPPPRHRVTPGAPGGASALALPRREGPPYFLRSGGDPDRPGEGRLAHATLAGRQEGPFLAGTGQGKGPRH